MRFLPTWHPTYAHICHIEHGERKEFENYDTGFYYVDERDGLNGPYGTAEAAKEALDEYTEYHND